MIKEMLNIKFHRMPVYDEKNFLGDGVTKENIHYTCIACITIDSVMRMEKKIICRFIQKNANKEWKRQK